MHREWIHERLITGEKQQLTLNQVEGACPEPVEGFSLSRE
jgi:hypothetical protein